MSGRTLHWISRFTEQFSKSSAQATCGHGETRTRHKRTWGECRPIDNSGFRVDQLMLHSSSSNVPRGTSRAVHEGVRRERGLGDERE